MKINKIGTYPHKIYNYYSNDFQGKVTLDRLINMVLDSAGAHAEENGFGKQYIIEKGCTWVLSRMNAVMHVAPKSLGKLFVSTWIRDVKSAFSLRVFEIKDEKGKVLASATTLWSVINLTTRRLVPLGGVIPKDKIISPKDVLAANPKKINFERGEKVACEIAQYTDLDYNLHVNSNRYIQWALNSYDLEFWKKHYLKQLEVGFNHEVYCRDNVSVFKTDETAIGNIELFNETQQQTACKLRLHFSPC